MNKAFLSMLVLAGFAVIGQAAPEVRFPTRDLPPPQGVYITPAQFHAAYANGITISNISHRRFTASFPPPPVGSPSNHTFGSTVEVDVKLSAASPVARVLASANCTVRVTRGPNVGTTEVYDTEMLQLDLVGLPGGVRIRESPTLQSRGQTTIRPPADGNGFMIASFFDIFTEISTDNGANWSPLAPGTGPAHVEVRVDPTTVPQVSVPSSLLPPPNNLYISPPLFHLLYSNGIIVRDIRHRFFTTSRPPPPPGATQVHEFGSQLDYQISTDGGATFRYGRSPASTAALVRHRMTDGATQIYDTEMLSLNVSGGDLPPGVILRESPTLASLGGTSVERLPDGTFRIGSFFDIFTEVSFNNGQTWTPAREPGRVTLDGDAPESPFPDPNLPPLAGRYLSATRYSGRYVVPAAVPVVILVSNVVHRRFTASQPPPPPGGAQTHQFGSEVQMDVSMNGGGTWNQIVAPASAAVGVRSLVDADGARFFDTEMLFLSIAGGGLPQGVMIRESPTRASLGRTSMRMVTDGTGGIWDYISSFFDVFTELTIDGGQTWVPSTAGPKHVVLTNTPVIPPITIICPPDITVFTTTAAGEVVNYPPPIAAGGCDPAPTVNCAPPSGSVFPVGTTTVNCVASDSCGTPRATCAFKVTVVRRVVEIDKMPYGLAQLTLALPTGNEVVSLAGSSTVHVFFEGDAEGDASDDDGDGRDEVRTQMMEMDLRGGSSMGDVQVTLDPDRPSLGEIEEGGNFTPGRLDVPPFSAVGTADSFFDIFPIIRVGGQVYHTAGPLRMQATIRHKPPGPGDTYINPFTQPMPLLDANGRDTGIRVIREVHTPNPEKEIDDMPFGTAQVTLTLPNGGTETITMAGPSKVVVCVPPNGAAADTDGDGLEQVPTEMVSMDLRGSSSLGPVRATLDPTRRSLGEIEETANTTPGILNVPPFAPGTANSFFDIFPILTVGDMVLHPAQPIRMQSIIRHKPPGPDDNYVNPFLQPVPLLDANGNDTGIRIIREVHTPNPPKERDAFPDSLGKINLRYPNGQTERVIVSGLTTVEVCIDDRPGPNYGRAADLDGDGLDEVPTRMTQLMLTGNSSQGVVQIMLETNSPTLGSIEEKVNATPGVLDLDPFGNRGCANSYFDVRAIIKVGGRIYCTKVPLHIEAMICHKPPRPGESYMNLLNQAPVELVDCATGQGTGIFLTGEMHTPNPPKEIDVMPYGTVQITLALPNNATEVVTLAGSTTVEVGINDADGLAADTDGDGLDQVSTRMTQMDVRGNSSLGPVRATLDPTRPTLGEIEELANGTPGVLDVEPFVPGAPGANSFFDVFADFAVAGRHYHTAQPIRMQSVIKHKPPGPDDTYINPFTQPVDVLDENGNPTGIKIVREVHTPNPPRERDFFSYSIGKINLRHPDGHIERVFVAGPTMVDVGINDANGVAADTDGDGLDDVPTVMTQLSLMGNSSLGPVMVSLDPNQPTTGQIEEKVNGTPGVLDLDPFGNHGCANSYFDVHAIIKVGGRLFCPEVPLHIEAMICHKPPGPGEAYMNLVDQNIRLLDCATGQPTDFFITGEMHSPNPQKEIDNFPSTTAQVTVQLPNGGSEVLNLTGPTRVVVCIEPNGLAADTDADGREQVPTEMTLLQLAGNSSIGPVQMRLNPARRSLGEIEETINATPGTLDTPPFTAAGTSDSFFDVFVEVQFAGGQVLHNDVPFHMASVIRRKPPAPGDTYINPFTQPVPLLDANGNDTGIRIIREVHTPVPNCTNTIICPSNIVLWTCSPNGQTVTYPPPTASSSCNLPLIVTCAPPSGSNFPPGNNPVTCTARDTLGNSNSCTFFVRVILDTLPPVITCPSNIVIWTCSNSVVVPYTVTATDDCDTNVTITCTPAGNIFPPGTNTVTCVARDDCGHTSTCAFTVRVIRDTTPPVITCPSNIVVVTCNERERVTWTVSATDDCDPTPTVVCDPPSGTVFPIGVQTVTCRAIDDCGNVGRCEFRVEVRRSEPVPQLTVTPLPNNRIRICWSGTCTGWVLQCASDLNPPIQWRTVTNTPTVTGGLNCVILPATGKIQIYRLSKRDPQPPEVYSETDTFPPQGVYDAADEVTAIPVPGLPRPVLARWFRHPIPLPEIFPPRPPPCYPCPPDTFRFQTDLDFQVSLDDGTSWVDVHPEPKLNVSVAVLVTAQPPDPAMPGVRSFEAEILELNGTFMMTPAGAGGAGEGAALQRLMVRESPTRKSTGKTMIRQSAVGDGTFMIGSFFDVLIEVSLDNGQTWVAAQTPVRMTLGSKPAEQYADTDVFPPAGTYNTPRAQVNRYAGGIWTRWYMHRLQPIPIPIPPIPKPNPPCLECPDARFQFSTEILFQVSLNGTDWMDVGAMSDVRIRLRQSRALGDTRYFDMEMDMLNAQPQPEPPIGGAGVGMPASVRLRESPSRPSKGRTSVRKLPDGTYRIGSFFDIFTEVSTDGGATWNPSVEGSHVDYIASPPPQHAATEALPPPGSYNSPAAQITTFDNGILARWYRHPIPPVLCPPFCPRPGPCVFCPPDPFEFDTEISFQVSNDGGRSWLDAHADSHTKGGIQPCVGAGGVITYDTEITQLDVRGTLMAPVGQIPFMLRESPTRRSMGFTEVQKFADGTFRIGSFFDIFTEISTDGGNTWARSKEATHVVHQDTPSEQYEAAATFPPPGSYNSPAPEVTDFGGGILTRWYLHKVGPFPPVVCPVCPPPPCLECPAPIYRFDADIRLQWSQDGGGTWNDALAKSQNTIRVDQTSYVALNPQPLPPGDPDVHFFETEILQLDISGGTMPPGVMIRESPTRRSLGRTSLRQVPGLPGGPPSGYRIGSFFDIWPELSLDGGHTWMPARKPSHVELVADPPPVAERTDLFPPAGSYNSPSAEITRFPNGLLTRRYRHPIIIPPIIPRPPPPCVGPGCPPEIYEFQTDLLFEYSVNGGQIWQEGRVPSQVAVRATTCWFFGGLRGYSTEMLRLDAQIPIPGTPGILLRESPTDHSMGMTTIMDSPSLSLPYIENSFFDINTEISLDGGATWLPSLEPTHVELQPQ